MFTYIEKSTGLEIKKEIRFFPLFYLRKLNFDKDKTFGDRTFYLLLSKLLRYIIRHKKC